MNKWLSENQSCASPIVDENIEDAASALKTIDTKVLLTTF